MDFRLELFDDMCVSKVTQSNAASAEEAASAAEELSAQANALNGMVSDLVSLVEGRVQNGGAAPRPAAGKKKASPAPMKRLEAPGSMHSGYSRNAPSSARNGENVKMVSAADVIPLGEDDEF